MSVCMSVRLSVQSVAAPNSQTERRRKWKFDTQVPGNVSLRLVYPRTKSRKKFGSVHHIFIIYRRVVLNIGYTEEKLL